MEILRVVLQVVLGLTSIVLTLMILLHDIRLQVKIFLKYRNTGILRNASIMTGLMDIDDLRKAYEDELLKL